MVTCMLGGAERYVCDRQSSISGRCKRLFKKLARPLLGLRVVDLDRGHKSLRVFLLKDSVRQRTRSGHTQQPWQVRMGTL